MGPAGQRLESTQLLGGQLDDRLEHDSDLATGDSATERTSQARPSRGLRRGLLRLINLLSRCRSGLLHRFERVRDHIRAGGAGRSPNADADCERFSPHLERLARDALANPIGQLERFTLIGDPRTQDGEHVPVQPPEDVVARQLMRDPLADQVQHVVGALSAVDLSEGGVLVDSKRNREHIPAVASGRQPLRVRNGEGSTREARRRVLQPLPGERAPEVEHHLHGRGQILEDTKIKLIPDPRLAVDRAQRADGMAVLEDERNPGVGDHGQITDRQVVGDQRVLAGVLDHEPALARNGVLAERMAERNLARPRPGRQQARRAREEFPVTVDQRHE